MIEKFLEYLANFLKDLACIFEPLGGIFLTNTVILSIKFIFEMEVNGEKYYKNEFIKKI